MDNSSDCFYLSDPCYRIGTWCQAVVNSVRNGSWKGYIQQDEEGDYNASVIAIHSEYENELKNLKWDTIEEVIGVDSGQAGIYDYWLYRNDEFVGNVKIRYIFHLNMKVISSMLKTVI